MFLRNDGISFCKVAASYLRRKASSENVVLLYGIEPIFPTHSSSDLDYTGYF